MASIFVSHSSQDAEQATRLLAWLRAQGFDETFVDINKHGGIALLGASGSFYCAVLIAQMGAGIIFATSLFA